MSSQNLQAQSVIHIGPEQSGDELFILPVADSTEVQVTDGSQAHLMRQGAGELMINVGANVELTVTDCRQGQALSGDIQVDMNGADSFLQINSVLLGGPEDILQSDIKVNHFASRTTSRIITKGILSGNARLVHTGLVSVAADTFGCIGEQRAAALMLSDDARADLRPDLQINTDDVRCSHAATVSGLDSLQLYYLMSRGLNRQTATEALVRAFAAPVLEAFCAREQAELLNHLTFEPDVLVRP